MIAVGTVTAVLAALLTSGMMQDFTTQASVAAATAPVPMDSAPLVRGSLSAPDWVQVAAAVTPSLVTVRAQAGGGEGSGVILNSQGAMLTTSNTIANADNGRLTVTLADGRLFRAALVGSDPGTGLAVIGVIDPPPDLRPAAFGNSAATKIGTPVLSVANAQDRSVTVAAGIISARNRSVALVTNLPGDDRTVAPGAEPRLTDAIQTDVTFSLDRSGGALVDATGRVIGISCLGVPLGPDGLDRSAGSGGLGFAIPSDDAVRVADQLLSRGRGAR